MTEPTAAEARAAAQERQRVGRAGRAAALDARFGDAGLPGRGLVVASWAATLVFAGAALLGATVRYDADLEPFPGDAASTAVFLVLFGLGVLVFLVALYAGAQRSREAAMGIGGWFFLSGTAPARIRWVLLGPLVAQTAGGLAVAAARPYSTLAFALLPPVLPLALCGWWGAVHGAFPQRPGRSR